MKQGMMFERYTEAARRAIFFARLEALHRNQSAIAPSDLLIGLTWESGTRADKIAHLKERAVAIREVLGIPHLPTSSAPYLTGRDIPLDDLGKKAIAMASKEADADREFWIDCDHLLRSLMAFPNSASAALTSVGISLPEVRVASRSRTSLIHTQGL